jgi:hypothetical protein
VATVNPGYNELIVRMGAPLTLIRRFASKCMLQNESNPQWKTKNAHDKNTRTTVGDKMGNTCINISTKSTTR